MKSFAISRFQFLFHFGFVAPSLLNENIPNDQSASKGQNIEYRFISRPQSGNKSTTGLFVDLKGGKMKRYRIIIRPPRGKQSNTELQSTQRRATNLTKSNCVIKNGFTPNLKTGGFYVMKPVVSPKNFISFKRLLRAHIPRKKNIREDPDPQIPPGRKS